MLGINNHFVNSFYSLSNIFENTEEPQRKPKPRKHAKAVGLKPKPGVPKAQPLPSEQRKTGAWEGWSFCPTEYTAVGKYDKDTLKCLPYYEEKQPSKRIFSWGKLDRPEGYVQRCDDGEAIVGFNPKNKQIACITLRDSEINQSQPINGNKDDFTCPSKKPLTGMANPGKKGPRVAWCGSNKPSRFQLFIPEKSPKIKYLPKVEIRNGIPSCPVGSFIVGVNLWQKNTPFICTKSYGQYSKSEEYTVSHDLASYGIRNACYEGDGLTGFELQTGKANCAPTKIGHRIDTDQYRKKNKDYAKSFYPGKLDWKKVDFKMCPPGFVVAGVGYATELQNYDLICGQKGMFEAHLNIKTSKYSTSNKVEIRAGEPVTLKWGATCKTKKPTPQTGPAKCDKILLRKQSTSTGFHDYLNLDQDIGELTVYPNRDEKYYILAYSNGMTTYSQKVDIKIKEDQPPVKPQPIPNHNNPSNIKYYYFIVTNNNLDDCKPIAIPATSQEIANDEAQRIWQGYKITKASYSEYMNACKD